MISLDLVRKVWQRCDRLGGQTVSCRYPNLQSLACYLMVSTTALLQKRECFYARMSIVLLSGKG